jgi:hypothetical protein
MVTIIDKRLEKTIEDAEQMLIVCAHAGAKVSNAVVRCAARLQAMLDGALQANRGAGHDARKAPATPDQRSVAR